MSFCYGAVLVLLEITGKQLYVENLYRQMLTIISERLSS